MVFLQDLQKRQSIHARHFQIQRDDIRLEGKDLVTRHVGIASIPHDLELRIPGKRVADGAPGQRRIIHDQYPDLLDAWLHVF
jgi:hypothetical protein